MYIYICVPINHPTQSNTGGGGGVLGIYIGGGVPWHTKKRGVLGAGTAQKGGS